MSKEPDVSAFPILHKGGAKPIAIDEATVAATADQSRDGEAVRIEQPLSTPTLLMMSARQAVVTQGRKSQAQRPSAPDALQTTMATPSGQTAATTVKLDEDRYLRLTDVGKPGRGRLK